LMPAKVTPDKDLALSRADFILLMWPPLPYVTIQIFLWSLHFPHLIPQVSRTIWPIYVHMHACVHVYVYICIYKYVICVFII
jgi:hypothetical protein